MRWLHWLQRVAHQAWMGSTACQGLLEVKHDLQCSHASSIAWQKCALMTAYGVMFMLAYCRQANNRMLMQQRYKGRG